MPRGDLGVRSVGGRSRLCTGPLLGTVVVATVPVTPLRAFGSGGGFGLINHAISIGICPTKSFWTNRLCDQFSR
jgi:hypothetical protein